jgi:oligopeptide/dipeptide ABC transporter ATP-binding protein
MDDILDVQDLKVQFFTYGGVVQAVDGVTFQVKKGETLGLVGETGCGKSVTSLAILRLVPAPGRIVAGEIKLKGENLLTKTEGEMRKLRGCAVAMIFQDPTSSLNPLFTVGYQISEPFIYHRDMKKEDVHKAVVELLESMQIPDAERRTRNYPHELSGGMRQRIMVAMALACNPSLLIADEPTTNLDVTIQAQLLELMKELQKKYDTSILWISHNLGVIAEMCDRVAVMYAGNIVEIGDVKTVLCEPAHPYTRMLKECVPTANQKKGELTVIHGTVPNLINPPSGCRFHPRCREPLDICSKEKPAMVELERGHFISCWKYSQKGCDEK